MAKARKNPAAAALRRKGGRFGAGRQKDRQAALPATSRGVTPRREGFSVERLMTLLTVLDQDVEIVIKKKPRSRSVARISVVAA